MSTFEKCGHPTTPDNLRVRQAYYVTRDGARIYYDTVACATCARAFGRRYRAEKRAGLPPRRVLPPRVLPLCPECGHRVSVHRLDDELRCYHRDGGEYDCDCVMAARRRA
jgi:hypothetical protein